MAANVSRMWWRAFSTTASGRALPGAAAMYSLSTRVGALISRSGAIMVRAAPSACDRLAELLDKGLVGGLDGVDDLLDVLAAGRRHIEAAARRHCQELRVLHGVVERLLQGGDTLGRHVR